MARVALLIGTEEYGSAFKKLETVPRNVQALVDVLSNSTMGGFDQVLPMVNPTHGEMAEHIETWLKQRDKDDFVLLYITGHGVKDTQRRLYFAATTTRKEQDELVTSTAVAAEAVHDWLRFCKAKQQVVILDCCFSGAFGNLLTQDDGAVNLEEELSAEGRVVLTSSSSMEYSFQQREGDLSVYTHYLVDGIRTGAADLNEDGAICVDDVHRYTSRKVQEESPAMTPKIIVVKDAGYRLRIAAAPLKDPRVKYRREVERIVQEDGGEIDVFFSRPLLEKWQQKLDLTSDETQEIENQALEPFRQYQSKVCQYEEIFEQAAKINYPFDERQQSRLKQIQEILRILDRDIVVINNRVLELLAKEKQPSILSQDTQKFEEKSDAVVFEDLASEVAIDYSRLKSLLQSQDWNNADHETLQLMLRTSNRVSNKELDSSSLYRFPDIDLQTIDKLWIKHSNGKFGFSIQREIWRSCGSPGNAEGDGSLGLGNSKWKAFGECVGWKKGGEWLAHSKLK
jgi:hypothetical protein